VEKNAMRPGGGWLVGAGGGNKGVSPPPPPPPGRSFAMGPGAGGDARKRNPKGVCAGSLDHGGVAWLWNASVATGRPFRAARNYDCVVGLFFLGAWFVFARRVDQSGGTYCPSSAPVHRLPARCRAVFVDPSYAPTIYGRFGGKPAARASAIDRLDGVAGGGGGYTCRTTAEGTIVLRPGRRMPEPGAGQGETQKKCNPKKSKKKGG